MNFQIKVEYSYLASLKSALVSTLEISRLRRCCKRIGRKKKKNVLQFYQEISDEPNLDRDTVANIDKYFWANGCGSVGRAAPVRIQSLAKIYNVHRYLTFEKTKINKKRSKIAHFQKSLINIFSTITSLIGPSHKVTVGRQT